MNQIYPMPPPEPRLKVVLVGVNASYIHTALAIRYLKQYSRCDDSICQNATIVCREFTINDPVRDTIAGLLDENAAIYGFSCYIWNIRVVLEITELLKKLRPACRIVLGGPEVSFETEDFFRVAPQIDVVVKGPGEEAFAALIREALGETSENPELSHRILEGVRVPLERIPFVYDEADFLSKQKIYYYETSRGCPFQCSYCLSSTDRIMDLLPMERILCELDFLIRQDLKQIKLVDRTFNFDDKRAVKIWRHLIERYRRQPFQTNFHFEIGADLLTQEALELLKESPEGLFQFEIGVQTTNETVLRHIARKTSLPRLFDRVKTLRDECSIAIHLDLIAGLPGETAASFATSFNDVFSLRPDMLQLGFLKVLKGSPIRDAAERDGLIFSGQAPYEIAATNELSFYELNRLKQIEEILERYYNSSLFHFSLEYLLRYSSDAFALFAELADCWETKGLFRRAVSRAESIREFFDFGRRLLVRNDGRDGAEKAEIFRDLLKWDYYRFDKKGNIEELGMNFGMHHPSLPREKENPAWYRNGGPSVLIKPRLERYGFRADLLGKTAEIVPNPSYVLYEMCGDRPAVVDILVL